jgi:hypothetical protein
MPPFRLHALQSTARLATLVAALAGSVTPLAAQGAVDPRVAPRAAALIREGERGVATDMLGRYLATAHEDGRAWLQLGRLYLLEAHDWHRRHQGQPDASLYLEFAAAALEQSRELLVDSGTVFRAMVEVERAILVYEDSGWVATRRTVGMRALPPLPGALAELGRNLLASCPAGGVLLTGGEAETVSAWYAALLLDGRATIVPIRPDLYVTDERYREVTARLLAVDPRLPLRAAVAATASRRPVCITPGTDTAAVPQIAWKVSRLVRVSRGDVPGDVALSFAAFAEEERARRGEWLEATRDVYLRAARINPKLCPSLATVFAGAPPAACRP